MKQIPLLMSALLTGGCAATGGAHISQEPRLTKIEIIKHSIAPHRVFTMQEILQLPDDLSVAELFEVFGRGVGVAMEVAPFFVLPREAHANSEEEKFRYGFYVWPSKMVRAYSDDIPIGLISWNPEGVSFGEPGDSTWIESQTIIWPPRLAGQRHPGYILAFGEPEK